METVGMNNSVKLPLRIVFDSFDNAHACLGVLSAMVPNMTFDRERMRNAASRGHATATDLADYLVRGGLAFRDAHEVVGTAVQLAESSGRELDALSLEELRGVSDRINEDVFEILTLEGSLHSRNHIGGTAPDQVRLAAAQARQVLAER